MPRGPSPNASVPRWFGTDGIRLVVGQEMTPVFVAEVGAALSTYLNGSGDVLLARDFRTSSEAMARLLSGSLLMNGLNVRDLGTMPTPCLQFNVKAMAATMGITVTASHNPTEFNGIKFTGPEGTELPRSAEEAIERVLYTKDFLRSPWDRVGTLRTDGEGIDRYLTSIIHHTDVAAIRRAKPLVVLDPGNGTSAVTSPRLLTELGCRFITLNANPSGFFPGRPSEPIEENLGSLKQAVVGFGAALGIAHDGDSDRIAFVDDQGRFVSGDVAMAIFARERLRERPGATVVTSVTSSSLIQEVVEAEGGRLEITRSGSLPVAERINAKHAAFGGEENGGYYWPEHQTARDGPMSSARMIELLARSGVRFSALVDGLPRHHVVKGKVRLPRPQKEPVMAYVRQELEREADRLLTVDGVKAYFPDGWLLVRPSGTEPICRLFAEAVTAERALSLREHGSDLVTRGLASAPGETRG